MKKDKVSIMLQIAGQVILFALIFTANWLYRYHLVFLIASIAGIGLLLSGLILEFRAKKEAKRIFPWYVILYHGLIALFQGSATVWVYFAYGTVMEMYYYLTASFIAFVLDLAAFIYFFSTNVPMKKSGRSS